MKITLIKVDEPAEGTASVATTDSPDPHFLFMDFAGDVDFACGHCGNVFVKGLESADQVTGIVFKCPSCKKYSATRT